MSDSDKPSGMGMRPYLDMVNEWAVKNLPEGVTLEEYLEWASGDLDRHNLEKAAEQLIEANRLMALMEQEIARLGNIIIASDATVSRLRDTVAERDAEIDTLRAMIADEED